MNIAQDDDELCQTWSEDGECTQNARHTLLHCPVSCEQAAGWNPWARRTIGITENLPFDEAYYKDISSCMNPVDLSGAASVMKTQLSITLEGGIRMAPGFTVDAFDEYAGKHSCNAIMFKRFFLPSQIVRNDWFERSRLLCFTCI
jgi:hypothetical protein